MSVLVNERPAGDENSGQEAGKQQQQQQQQQNHQEPDNNEQQASNNSNKSSETTAQSKKRLAEFYAGKEVLVTGATGFIGKVALVKLVKALPGCERVYVMLRPKKGLSAQQRFNKLLNEAPFRDEPELNWSKVVAIEGDMSCDELGLAQEVKQKLCDSVDIVFNIAASVQFDAPLKQNLRDNYMGTNNLLQLAVHFRRLVSLVHVSTFYSNSHISHVEERVLPMTRDCEKMAELISWMPDQLCDTIAPQIMENRPNTYIFTKAMAENLVQKYQGRLPLAILRPSIVTPSVEDPYPGWVDNVNGPMGLGTLASLGILRNIDWNYYGVADFIPVDFVVNSMLAVAERTARLNQSEIKVYNCSSSSLNPCTWGECFETLREEGFKAPPYKMLRIPIKPPRHKRANPLAFKLTKLNELLFAYFIDFILMLCGQKQLLTKLTAKLHHGYDILLPFTTNEYTCSNDNLEAAYEELHPDDKREFNFNIRRLNWAQNFRDAYHGTRRRLLKEGPENIPAARLKMRIIYLVEFVFQALVFVLVAWNSYRLYERFFPTMLPASLTSTHN